MIVLTPPRGFAIFNWTEVVQATAVQLYVRRNFREILISNTEVPNTGCWPAVHDRTLRA